MQNFKQLGIGNVQKDRKNYKFMLLNTYRFTIL